MALDFLIYIKIQIQPSQTIVIYIQFVFSVTIFPEILIFYIFTAK